ncbi:ABC transporter ATP-binding protein [Phytoactinopolyspora alkaliphila]|uniref:ABC transporter ATP-binding protein n=1 Tax=Phytoactinopolyspora alkaliphila TaxID=1783498 RepID=A0A6N9YKJ5_9ACTN|nr:ABC transporter ATP-binding protein [Phytoactinopolyspora alkaliphila]NED95430.1 ABC transporter ATP-binding protein [Phytoactinopolyspora alkaliphila]
MTQPFISVHNLSKRYGGRQVLHDVTFEAYRGEILGIVGRNGMGKTTTVEIVQGLRDRDGGQVDVAGHDPAHDRSALREVVGAQLQSCALPDRMRVDEALRVFTRLAGDVVDWRELREQWGLTQLGRSAYGGLSGGERQRLFIALALANRPRVVFLDELTQGLDPVARQDTWRLVRQVRDRGATVVLVTHDMEEAHLLCDRVVLLHQGRVSAVGTPRELAAGVCGGVRISFSAQPVDLSGIESVPGVATVRHDGTTAEVTGSAVAAVTVAAELARRGLAPHDYDVHRPGLAEAFLLLTTPPANESETVTPQVGAR